MTQSLDKIRQTLGSRRLASPKNTLLKLVGYIEAWKTSLPDAAAAAKIDDYLTLETISNASHMFWNYLMVDASLLEIKRQQGETCDPALEGYRNRLRQTLNNIRESALDAVGEYIEENSSNVVVELEKQLCALKGMAEARISRLEDDEGGEADGGNLRPKTPETLVTPKRPAQSPLSERRPPKRPSKQDIRRENRDDEE